jgi:hypothetical protein
MTTGLTKLLQIKYPIIQAPIGSATSPGLAAAVSNAGGLGNFGGPEPWCWWCLYGYKISNVKGSKYQSDLSGDNHQCIGE